MISLIRSFKRRYHKVKKIYAQLRQGENWGFEIKSDGQQMSAKNTTPNEKDLIPFIVLMRTFLHPLDQLYYKKVWAAIKKDFSEYVPENLAQNIETSIERLLKGNINIKINGENINSEKAYQIIAEKSFFNQSDEFPNLFNNPVIETLFWHQFYNYSVQAFHLISLLFDIIQKIEKSEKFLSYVKQLYKPPNRCIYCLSTTKGFDSEEHIIPEALGNDTLVLPKGNVCNTCNNRILSQLDNYLVNFEPISLLQVLFVAHKKDGKLPNANFQNLSLQKTRPGYITLTPKDKTGDIKNFKKTQDGLYSFNIEFKGKKFDPKFLGRALYKVALGLVAYERGNDIACSAKYENARNFIRYGKPFANNLLMSMKGQPHPQIKVSYLMNMSEGTPIGINIFGIIFLLNLESKPIMQLNKALKEFGLNFFSLS